MNTFEFEIIIQTDIRDLEDASNILYEGGCDDSFPGMGAGGIMSIEFTREATSAYEAIRSACSDVMRSLPEARFIEVSPDLVGVSDIAYNLDISRQYVQKLKSENSVSFPTPIHAGGKNSLWHFSDILLWMGDNTNKNIDPDEMEIAMAARRLNQEIRSDNPVTNSVTRVEQAQAPYLLIINSTDLTQKPGESLRAIGVMTSKTTVTYNMQAGG